MFSRTAVLRHVKGTDQTITLPVYVGGALMDWSEYDASSSELHLYIRTLGGTAVDDILLSAASGADGTFPTSSVGIVSFPLTDSDFSSNACGEYIWWIAGESLAAASGESPTYTGEHLFDHGRFLLSAPDQSDATP